MNSAGDLAAFVNFGNTEVDLWDAEIRPGGDAALRHGAEAPATAPDPFAPGTPRPGESDDRVAQRTAHGSGNGSNDAKGTGNPQAGRPIDYPDPAVQVSPQQHNVQDAVRPANRIRPHKAPGLRR
jgi:hypothetical protein